LREIDGRLTQLRAYRRALAQAVRGWPTKRKTSPSGTALANFAT